MHGEQQHLPGPSLQKRYYLHDIQITCATNHSTIFALLDDLLGAFPRPARVRGEVSYTIACYDHASQFSDQIPADRKHTETIQLVTGSKMRIFVSRDDSTRYLAYAAQPSMHKVALSVIRSTEHSALTQLDALEENQPHFLRRCVFLLALGELMRAFHYEPCHAATVTAPWNDQQGALIFGSSGSGKTTLSMGCALSGWGLLGDDLLMLREQRPGEPGHLPCGDIHAYALLSEVSVRAGTLEIWPQLAFLRDEPADFRGKRHCSVECIRPGAFHRETAVRLLIFPTLVESGRSGVTRLSKAQTLAELVEQCMRIEKTYPQSQGRLFTLLGQLAEQAPGYRLTLARDTHDGPRLLSELFAGGANA
jgi:hypothetical protein